MPDFTHECTVGFSGALQEFRAGFCSACAQRQCQHAFVNNSATAKKVQKHQEMMQFREPSQFQSSKSLPIISEEIQAANVVETYPPEELENLETEQRGDAVVQFVQPEKEITTANLDEIKAKLAETKARTLVRTPPEPIPQPVPVVLPQPVKADPWSLPLSSERVIDYSEKEPAKDPWSKEYKGDREIKGAPGVKITVTE